MGWLVTLQAHTHTHTLYVSVCPSLLEEGFLLTGVAQVLLLG